LAKYGNKHFIQLPREIFTEEYNSLSRDAKWLYVVLKEDEHRYTSGKQNGKNYFYRSDKDLAADAQMSITTLKKYKKELKEKAPNLVIIEVDKFIKGNKLSEESMTFYTML